MLVASKSKSDTELVKELLRNEFEMKDMGKASKILGMEIMRNRSTVHHLFLKKITSKRC